MDSSGFDASQWTHWLLVISFVGVAGCGLWLSGKWRIARYQRRARFFSARPVFSARPIRSSRGSASKWSRTRGVKSSSSQVRLTRQLARQMRAQQHNRHAP